MRISDWSSDVCSSDLLERLRGPQFSLKVEQPLRSVGYAGCGRDAAHGVRHRRRIIGESMRQQDGVHPRVRAVERSSERVAKFLMQTHFGRTDTARNVVM